jgi:8-oxo-dGTP diphosphatase
VAVANALHASKQHAGVHLMTLVHVEQRVGEEPATDAESTAKRASAPAVRASLTARRGENSVSLAMNDPEGPETAFEVPRIPASAGALIRDSDSRLLILKPNYKKGWTIPGGQIEANGESPWEGCRRETREECGLEIVRGRLVCVDFLHPKPPRRLGGMRFLFDCGQLDDRQLGAITLDSREIDEHLFVPVDQALELLSGPVRRRVSAGVRATACVYLEDGRPVEGVDVPGNPLGNL